MSLAEEMLSTMSVSDNSASYLADEEAHIVINDSRLAIVPNELKTIAVTGDKDIETITFDCVRYWDGYDLSTFAIYLNYVLPDMTTGTYIPESIVAEDDVYHFDWKIKNNITKISGHISFAITAIKTKQNESGETVVDQQWSSIPNGDCSIAIGLDISNVPSEEESSGVLAQMSAILEQIQSDIKVSFADIVQTTGQSIDKVMSQKATTDALGKKIEKPEVSPTVGTVLKVTAVNDDGTFTCAWANESSVDVQINGTSIVQDSVANIPYATDKNAGVLRITYANGLYIQNGDVRINPASNSQISNRNGQYMPLTSKNLDYAVKAAMCDGKGAAWTDTEKAAARSRMGVINGSTGKNFSLSLATIPDSAEQLHTDTNANKTLCRMTKANFLTFAPNCTAEMYERMLQGALVTQNDRAGAAVSSTLITYPPRYVGVGIRIPQEWLNATTLFDVMGDRRIAFFPDFEVGHESDIYFMFYGDSTKPIVNIIAY